VDGEDDREISRYTGQFGVTNIEKFILEKVPFAHSSILCRRNAMISVRGYSEDLPRAKDIDLYLKIAKLGKFGFLPKCFVKHREVSLKSKNDKEIIKSRCVDSFFHKKVIWRHRKDFPHFIRSYFKITLRYLILKILIIFPFFYKIYKTMRYNKEYFLPTLRIPSINRFSLNRTLFPVLKKLKKGGAMLEIGYSPDENYKNLIPHTEYLNLDIEARNNPDICCDVCDIKWQSDYFDTVIAIEVLEHVHSPEKAVNEIWRILKPGGNCVLSTRFLHFYHPGPKDYYRFTWDSLSLLFKNFKKVEIYPHGNGLQSIWHIITSGKAKVIFNILNPLIAKINFRRTKLPLGFIVYVEK
jgi:SAM-dependent methyltransferase